MNIYEFSQVYFNLPKEERNINEWYPILNKYICKICNNFNFQTFEDRYQIAWIGAIKAIKDYDITKGYLFTTFLSTVINNELLMARKRDIRRLKIKPGEKELFTIISISKPISSQKNDEFGELSEIIVDPHDYINEIDAKIILDNLYKVIDKEDKDILNLLKKDLTQQQIADTLGISQTWVSRRLKRLGVKNRNLVSNCG